MRLSPGALELYDASRSPAAEFSVTAILVGGCALIVLPTLMAVLGSVLPVFTSTCDALSRSFVTEVIPAARVDCRANSRVATYPLVLITQLTLAVLTACACAVAAITRVRKGLSRLEDFLPFGGEFPSFRMFALHAFFFSMVGFAAYVVLHTAPDVTALSGRSRRLASHMQAVEVFGGGVILLLAAVYCWLILVGGSAAAIAKIRTILRQRGAHRDAD
jgi:hypothetical protein